MDKKTVESFNSVAKKYDDKTKDYWENNPSQFIVEFKKKISGRIIDVGSGPGRDASLLRSESVEVICLDASEEMNRLISQKGLLSILSDFANIPFKNEYFDGAWVYTSLLHVLKLEIPGILREINRIMKRDGILGLGLIEGEDKESGYYEYQGVGFPIYYCYYQEDEVRKLLEVAGFGIFYFEIHETSHRNFLHFLAKKL